MKPLHVITVWIIMLTIGFASVAVIAALHDRWSCACWTGVLYLITLSFGLKVGPTK